LQTLASGNYLIQDVPLKEKAKTGELPEPPLKFWLKTERTFAGHGKLESEKLQFVEEERTSKSMRSSFSWHRPGLAGGRLLHHIFQGDGDISR
jgi:hypothetical protein